jgi:hypothetical protein
MYTVHYSSSSLWPFKSVAMTAFTPSIESRSLGNNQSQSRFSTNSQSASASGIHLLFLHTTRTVWKTTPPAVLCRVNVFAEFLHSRSKSKLYYNRRSANSLRQYTTVCPLDDGRMTETCYGNNIRGGEEELLR